MAKQRNYSTEFKRQVVLEHLAGETLYGLSKRHDVSRPAGHDKRRMAKKDGCVQPRTG